MTKEYKMVNGRIVIGIISVNDQGTVMFKYSDDFKNSALKPIPNFPSLDKVYTGSVVMSFLLNRVPSKEFKSNKSLNPFSLIDYCKKIAHSSIELVG